MYVFSVLSIWYSASGLCELQPERTYSTQLIRMGFNPRKGCELQHHEFDSDKIYKRRKNTMLLLWIAIAIIINIGENIHDGWDAYKHPYQPPDCFKKKQ